MKEEMIDKIISVAYGDASLQDKILIYLRSFKEKEVKKVLLEHKQIARKTQNLQAEQLPDRVVNEVKNNIKKNNFGVNSILTDMISVIYRKPILIGVTVTAIFLAIVSTFVIDRPEIKEHYTKQEIELADEQVRESLNLVVQVLNKTKTTLEKDVLEHRVTRPIQKSIFLVDDYLTGDKDNEKLN